MVAKGENSQVSQLVAAGIPVWLEVRYAAAHNKILVADPLEEDSVVATGSYNYTYSAQARNAENLLIVRGNTSLARAYLDNWQRHRADALPFAEANLP
jgi:phosphatidylserine/phosphatidylglycerophosphate/cardiolipin synthase-like enzyme